MQASNENLPLTNREIAMLISGLEAQEHEHRAHAYDSAEPVEFRETALKLAREYRELRRKMRILYGPNPVANNGNSILSKFGE